MLINMLFRVKENREEFLEMLHCGVEMGDSKDGVRFRFGVADGNNEKFVISFSDLKRVVAVIEAAQQ